MPAIRKKTSNRGSTLKRKSIQNKARESRKKQKRDAKKSVQWVSKHKKDPGIPNEFPYKDQILAEVEEQRRQAAEEKQRKKASKNAARGLSPPPEKDDDDADFDGVASVSAKTLNVKATKKPKAVAVEEDEDDEMEIPALVNRDLHNVKAVLDASDVVMQVLDARDPLAFRSTHLEEYVPSSKLVFILNKIDLSPRETVAAWATELRKEHPTFLFQSASAFLPSPVQSPVVTKGKAKASLDDAQGVDSVLSYLGHQAKTAKKDTLTVSVVGLTNTGKSSVLNSLTKSSALTVYSLSSSSRGPTTTALPQELTLDVGGKNVKFVDAPGLLWEKSELHESDNISALRVRDILVRNKGRVDRLKDPSLPVEHFVSRANTEDLMLLYKLPAFTDHNSEAFIAGVSRSLQLVRKRGELDTAGACRVVLRDWSTGKIKWYASPAQASSEGNWDTKDLAILNGLPTKKEMRKAGGVVRFSVGSPDERRLGLEDPYSKPEHEVTEDDEDEVAFAAEDDADMVSDEEASEDDVDEDEEAEEEEEEPAVPVPTPQSESARRKRKREASATTPSAKRVAFASAPKGASKATINSSKAPKSIIKPAKAAKSSAPKKAGSKATASAGETEAYDFGKFF